MEITVNERPRTESQPAAARNASTVRERKVIDATTRMFHWLFAFSFAGAYVTSESEHFRLAHVTLGYTMVGLLVFRIIWGLIGPKHARLAPMFRKLAGLPAWFRSLRTTNLVSGVNWRQGQNLFMATAVTALLGMVIPVGLTGFATYNEWGGKIFEHLHEAAGEIYLGVVIAHLGLIALLSLLRWKNQAAPMITGKITGPGPDLVRNDYRGLALLLLGSVLAWWVWQCF